MQRLKVKEVLKPSVSNGGFCILFVAVDKKYAAGGKQETTAGKSGPPEAVPYIKSSKEKIVLAFCRRGIYNGGKSIKGQSVRRLVRRRRNRVRSPASWSL